MIKQAYAHNGITGYQPLDEHLHGVSRRCSQYARKIGLPLTGALIGLLHDLGKSSEIFQTYLRSFAPGSGIEPQDELRGKIDHSTAGAQCLVRNLPGAVNEASLQGLVARFLGLCIASHHSGLIDCLTPDGEDGLNRRLQKGDSQTRYAEAWDSIAPGVRVEAERLLHSPELIEEVRRMLSQILQGPVSGDRAMQLGLMARLLLSCLIDADRTDTSDFEKSHSAKLRQLGRYVQWAELLQRLESGLSQLPSSGAVNQERQRISEECAASASRPRGIYTLTVPTGGGKTLAALRFALRHAQLQTGNGEGGASRGIDRVIFVSPYISVVEQNAAVVRAFLEPEDAEASSVVLEHHSNLAEERDERAGNEHWRRKVLAENWDAPIVFTTMVQVLEALFGGGTRAVRRLHAMAGAVLVFDEVQTMPVRMVHLFNNAINMLSAQCGATIVLCTATQPLLGRVNKERGSAQMAATPELISDVAGTFGALRRYVVTDTTERAWTHHEVADLARRAVTEHGSCLVIVNTKRDAREIFRLCRTGIDPTVHLVHLSTGMCPMHRAEVLEGVKDRLQRADERVLCLSTQLIEAGVDIDFACVVRDLAGLDSLAQAAGRCNRHGKRTGGGHVHIVRLPELPKALDDIRQGREVAGELLALWRQEHRERPFPLDSPEQIERFYDRYFFRRQSEMSYPVGADKAARETDLLTMLGANAITLEERRRSGKPLSRNILLQSFKTANDAFQVIGPTQGVVVPFRESGQKIVADLCAAGDLDKQWSLLRRAQRYTLSLYTSQFRSLMDAGAVYQAGDTGVYCLRSEFYDESFGLRPEAGSLEDLIA